MPIARGRSAMSDTTILIGVLVFTVVFIGTYWLEGKNDGME